MSVIISSKTLLPTRRDKQVMTNINVTGGGGFISSGTSGQTPVYTNIINGTPSAGQVAVFHDASSIEGDNGFTYDSITGILKVSIAELSQIISKVTGGNGTNLLIQASEGNTAGGILTLSSGYNNTSNTFELLNIIGGEINLNTNADGYVYIRNQTGTKGYFKAYGQTDNGMDLFVEGGNANPTGVNDGGDLILKGGLKFSTGTDGSVYLGDTTNGIKVTNDGELSMLGTATVWDDIRIIPSIWDVAGGTDPDINDYTPGGSGTAFKVYAFAKGDQGWFTVQLPHGYKTGSDMKAHVHWTPGARGTAESTKVVQWRLDYSFAAIGSNFPSSSTLAIPGTCSGTNDKHEMTAEVTIPGTGLNISSQMFGRIYRFNDASDTWAGTGNNLPIFIEFDIHYEIDTIGSKTTSSK